MATTMLRLISKDNTEIVFFPRGEREQAIAWRKAHPNYKHARIVECLQMEPSKVTYGQPMSTSGGALR